MDNVREITTRSEFETLTANPVLLRTLARIGVFAVDYEGHRAFPNDLWLSWGFTAEDMLVNRYLDIIHPEDSETIATHHHRLISGAEDFFSGEYRIRTSTGKIVWISVSYEVLSRDASGRPRFLIGHDQDVTAIHEAQDELSARLLEVLTLQDLIASIHQSLDLAETLDLVMDHLKRVLQFDRASVQQLDGDFLRILRGYGYSDAHLTDLRFPVTGPETPVNRALRSLQAVVCNDLEHDFPGFVQSDPQFAVRSWLGIPLVHGGECIGILAIDSFQPGFYDEKHVLMANTVARQVATAIHHAMQHRSMEVKAETDPLTVMANRNGMDSRGRAMFELAVEEQRPLGLLLVDIDRFKVINDKHGHDHGDQVLRQVGAMIKDNLRSEDFPVRYGGDEFLVFLPGASLEDAFSTAERIRLRVAYATPDSKGVAPTVSIGVHSAIPSVTDRLHELVSCADRALYEAKSAGRNRACVSVEALQARS